MLLAEAGANTMTSAVGSLMEVVSTVMTTINGNSILLTFFCAGIVGIAIGVVKKLRAKQQSDAGGGRCIASPFFVSYLKMILFTRCELLQ